MTAAIQHAAPESVDSATMLQVVAGGDCSRLTPSQRIAYYNSRCEAAGLDPRAQPFQFVKLNGKEVLYALKSASDQLAAKHGVRLEIVSQATEDGIRVVTVRAIAKDGRQTDEIGAVAVKGLSGDALCNAMMKAVTKAKRRAVLSLCGLGMLDETEIESIPNAAPVTAPRVEVVKPPPEPAALAPAERPSEHVAPPANKDRIAALWKRAIAEFGELASDSWEAATIQALGENILSKHWSAEQARLVEAELFREARP